MIRFHSILAWLLSSLGLALIACSLVLVPTGSLWADGGGGTAGPPPNNCTNNGACDVNCNNQSTSNGCKDAMGNLGKCNNPNPPNGNRCTSCTCTPVFSSCQCQQ